MFRKKDANDNEMKANEQGIELTDDLCENVNGGTDIDEEGKKVLKWLDKRKK